MMYRMAFLALFPLSCFAIVQQEKEGCLDLKQCQMTLRHIEKGGIGYKEGYTTAEMFLIADPTIWSVVPFLDVRGHLFNQGSWAANGGIGVRLIGKSSVYGVHGYYDYRSTDRMRANQVGIGFEALGAQLDFRINGYLPVGQTTSHPYDLKFGGFSGHSLLLLQTYQEAMKGADTEVGIHFGKTLWGEFYAAAGPYYFVGDQTSGVWGGKGRLFGTFKEILKIELSDSYDHAFRNKLQGQISLNFSFGPTSKGKGSTKVDSKRCALMSRMVQPVARQEIIVMDQIKKKSPAIDPSTGLPYFFVFVNNTSTSEGTYESPYHTFSQVEDNSSAHDVIYVFPGDETTRGMDSGIFLKANQKLWGSGVDHWIESSQGTLLIPKQSAESPIITNTNIETDGNAITLAVNNSISGFTISSPINDAIYGVHLEHLELSDCTIEHVNTFVVEGLFPNTATVVIANNQFIENTNGLFCHFEGSASFECSNNRFQAQTSVSNAPIEIVSSGSNLTVQVQNSTFSGNTTGALRFNLESVNQAEIQLFDNTITDSGTGSQSSLGSSVVLITTGTTETCAIDLRGNEFSSNVSNSLYLHTSGKFTTLDVTATTNTFSNNGGSALVLATPVDHLTLEATENRMEALEDNAIGVISSDPSLSGVINIENNTIMNIANGSGIAINQDFAALDLTLSSNEISSCQGTGILSYAPHGIDSFSLEVTDNVVRNCENQFSNAASGISIEQFTAFEGTITGNTLIGNPDASFLIGSDLSAPTACLMLSGNSSDTGYAFNNPIDGLFQLAPCDVEMVNEGSIVPSGTITAVTSCLDGEPCPPGFLFGNVHSKAQGE